MLEQTDSDWQDVIDADLTAGWRLAREAARIMVPAGYGRMIFMSSIMGFVARPAVTGYVAAKTGLHRAWCARSRSNSRRAASPSNALAPGYFLDRGNSAVRREQPGLRELDLRAARRPAAGAILRSSAAAALYLASRAAAYTTGSVLTVDGGLTAAI